MKSRESERREMLMAIIYALYEMDKINEHWRSPLVRLSRLLSYHFAGCVAHKCAPIDFSTEEEICENAKGHRIDSGKVKTRQFQL